MEYKRLGDVISIKKGKKIEQVEESENTIRYIQIDDLRNDDNIKFCERNDKYVMAEKEDIIIAWDGANAGTVGFGLNGAIGSTLARLDINDNEIDTIYCAMFLRSKFKYLREKCTGATIPHLSRASLEDLKLPKPSLETQKKIVEVLDKAQSLIDKKKEQIDLLDELVKSRFIEMFGDPMINPYNWETIELKEIMKEKAMNGFFAKNTEYKEDGNSQVMWLGDVINRRYSNTKGLKRVDVTEKELEKYRVKYGDLLFCRSSLTKEGIGKASAVPRNIENNIMFECHIIKVNLDLEKCIPEFMQIQSSMDYFRNQIMSKSKTATMTTIGQEGIVTNKVILPPLEKQKIFVEFVRKIDEIKSKMETSLSELEDNFNSLMQRLFKGELF